MKLLSIHRCLWLIALLWLIFFPITAQTISVVSFYFNEKDLTANSRTSEVLDQNGDRCALIRVQTLMKGFVFDVGSAGVQKVDEDHIGEIWVWVPFGVRHISIRHPQLGSLPNYDFQIPIQKARSYIMEISSDKVFVNTYDDTRKQILAIKVIPSYAQMSLNGLRISLNEQGEAEQELSFGTYTYKVESEGYYPQEGQVIVADSLHKQSLIINNLRPRLGKLSLHLSPIFAIATVDGKQVNNTSLSPIELQIGQHVVQVVADGYREETKVVTIQETQTTVLQIQLSQVADYQITSKPSGAQVYLDGGDVGITPCTVTLASGTYDLRATLYRHKDYEKPLTFNSSTPQIQVQLKEIQNYWNECYIEAGVNVGSYIAYGVTIGGFVKNINLEGAIRTSASKSEYIYWGGNITDPQQAQYTPRIDVRCEGGYGFSMGTRVRITPQLGVKFLKLEETVSNRSYTVADGANVWCGVGAVRCSVALGNVLKLSVTPEYTIALSKSNGFELLSQASPTIQDWSNGASVKLGLAVYL